MPPEAKNLPSDPLDLLIVGGGILGAGIARDAAMRGLHTALVEQYDFASGTSSRSSRLLHGGLRYLAQGRLQLVHEASREKRILHRIAPHLAQPLPFLFPTYRHTPWPLWKLRIGVKLYDLLCGTNLGPSSSLSAQALLHRLPNLNPHVLTGAVRYFDALTDDARLVIDTLRSAARHGALLRNHTRFEDARRDGPLWRIRLHDLSTDSRYEVRARYIINAAGPWAHRLPGSSLQLRLTKGVHLVIDRARLPIPEALVMTEASRILFAIPWGQRIILGTTDTDFHAAPESVAVDPSDINYILRITNQYLPSAALTESDILSTFAGLRPLIDDRRAKPSDISRAHQIRLARPGWIDVAGGKLTTHRLIALQSINCLLKDWHRTSDFPPSRTAIEPLLAPDDPRCGVVPAPPTQSAVQHFIRHEWASHLDDVMLRRSSWHQYYGNTAPTLQIAQWMATELNWSPTRLAEELKRSPSSC